MGKLLRGVVFLERRWKARLPGKDSLLDAAGRREVPVKLPIFDFFAGG